LKVQVQVEVGGVVFSLDLERKMPRPRKSALAAVKAEAQEVRGGNAYLQQFTDVRTRELAVFSRLSTKKALPRLDAAIKPLWADASATVCNTPVGQRRLRSADCTRLERLHGANVKNHIANLLDKASKDPEKQRIDLTDALILLKQLQLYDSCMPQPGCVPDWLQALRQANTAKRHSELREVIVLSDDNDGEIIDADNADISTASACDGTEPVSKRAKLELNDSNDGLGGTASSVCLDNPSHDDAVGNADTTDAGHMAAAGDSAALECDGMISSQHTTNLMVMHDVSTLNCHTEQIDTNDATMNLSDEVALADTTADSVGAILRVSADETSKQQHDSNISSTSSNRESSQTVQTSDAVTEAAADDTQSSYAAYAALEIVDARYRRRRSSAAVYRYKTDTDQNIAMTSSTSDNTRSSWHGDQYFHDVTDDSSYEHNNSVVGSSNDGTTSANEVSTVGN
jgi:hypothetical protein